MALSLKSRSWSEFFIGDIADIKSGSRLIKDDMVDGRFPYVGASQSNNGVTDFISNENDSLDSNILGVNTRGSVGECFYHPYPTLFSDSVKRLSLKNISGEISHYLFLKNAILKQKDKYSFGYQFSGERMSRQKIMLPVNDHGQPDWDFMSEYMQSLMKSKRAQYASANA